jgi:hypothetical protein
MPNWIEISLIDNSDITCIQTKTDITFVLLPALRNSDLADDIKCALKIKNSQGFKAWTTYSRYCTKAVLPRCWTGPSNPLAYTEVKEIKLSQIAMGKGRNVLTFIYKAPQSLFLNNGGGGSVLCSLSVSCVTYAQILYRFLNRDITNH